MTTCDAPADKARLWTAAKTAGLRLRPATDGDRAFLFELYASTREQELTATGWPDAAKQAFLEQQFAAQDEHYRRHYAGSDFLVVEFGSVPVGRLYLARWAHEHRIVDIALGPEWRAKGLGEAILRDVIGEAQAAGRSVSIHIERMNRALSLYARLGFRLVEDKGVYLLLETGTPGRCAADFR